MTDKQTLVSYRMAQAEETLSDAEIMLKDNGSPRSVINRAYYSMFYAVLALLLHSGINPRTSKHSGVLSMFDKEFVKTGRIDASFSKALHRLFDQRLKGDYKEMIEFTPVQAQEGVAAARVFLAAIKAITADGM
ncbi:MAG: HEPN domain-containing protein [Nitrospirae bacterium]|nr:HEPN domain-containing protein [Nitrospirota bacterium]